MRKWGESLWYSGAYGKGSIYNVGARPLWASAEDGMKGDEIEPRAASSDRTRSCSCSVSMGLEEILVASKDCMLSTISGPHTAGDAETGGCNEQQRDLHLPDNPKLESTYLDVENLEKPAPWGSEKDEPVPGIVVKKNAAKTEVQADATEPQQPFSLVRTDTSGSESLQRYVPGGWHQDFDELANVLHGRKLRRVPSNENHSKSKLLLPVANDSKVHNLNPGNLF
jgi:hypothetical protein